MSYFNFKLFNRPVKNVNTDLAFKQGNWAPGYPIKGGRAPILGYRKHLECCNISGWPISFDLYISNNLYASGPGIGRWTIVPELWVRPSIAALPDTPYNPVYKGPNDSTGNPTYMTFGYGAATSPADPKQWNIFNSKYGTTGLEWLIHFDVSQTFGDPPAPPATAYRFTNMPNSLSANFTTVESLNLPSYPNKISEKGELNLIQKIFTVTNIQGGGTVTISNLLNRTPTPNEKIYKDNWAKSCARNGEVCYNPVIKRIQNKNGKIDNTYNYNTYNYNTRNLLRSRFSTYEQNAYNFDLSGNLTAWAGGADPANNSYLIHDCSCNAPFTSNNPCIATYKPLNRQFAVNTAVSGRSRIARLKYNTKKRVAVTKKIPFGLLGYPKNSCEFCKRDFKPSKGRKGGDDKRRINSRLPYPESRTAASNCCSETLPAGVIKICTGFNSGSNCISGTYSSSTYDTVGYLKDAQPDWTNGSGCDGWDTIPPTPPTTGRLGNYTTAGYPDIGTMCPPDATYRGHTIGGFAWNPVDEHLWFFLKDADMFTGGATPSGFQFTSIEFSNSPSFPVGNTAILYAGADGTDYDSGSTYEIHWSGAEGVEPELTGWTTALPKLINIFGDGSVDKSVYIKFDL